MITEVSKCVGVHVCPNYPQKVPILNMIVNEIITLNNMIKKVLEGEGEKEC